MAILCFNEQLHKDKTACLVCSVSVITFLYYQFPITVTAQKNSQVDRRTGEEMHTNTGKCIIYVHVYVHAFPFQNIRFSGGT